MNLIDGMVHILEDVLQENSSTFVIYPDNVTQDLKFNVIKKKSLIK